VISFAADAFFWSKHQSNPICWAEGSFYRSIPEPTKVIHIFGCVPCPSPRICPCEFNKSRKQIMPLEVIYLIIVALLSGRRSSDWKSWIADQTWICACLFFPTTISTGPLCVPQSHRLMHYSTKDQSPYCPSLPARSGAGKIGRKLEEYSRKQVKNQVVYKFFFTT